MPLVPFSWDLGRGSSRCGESRFPLRCHSKRDISCRCRNQQRGGQCGRLTSECSETTPTWIRRYNPGQAHSTPESAPASIPTPSVRSPSGGSSPVDLVLSRRTSVHISPSSTPACAYLPFSSTLTLEKNAPLPSLCPFSPVHALPSHLSLSQ